ncbi:hypothetical protein LMIY3S_04233 [Labrys miyagiensis]
MAYTGEQALDTARRPDGPVGIGGWLILPILGLCGTILLTGYNLYSVVSQWEGIKAIILGSNETAAALRVPVGLSALSGFVILGLAALCLYRIFTYSPTVPRLMTIFYVALLLMTLGEVGLDKMMADTLGTAMDPNNLRDVIRVVAGAAIWIPYFNRSRRVANTFRAREAMVDKKIGEIF